MLSLNIAGIVNGSIVDGPGIRTTIFVQGCPHMCEGCHNPQTHSFNSGKDMTIDEVLAVIKSDPLSKGVTFSGGEPFCQAKALAELAKTLKSMGREVAIYSGYTYEQLVQKNDIDINNLLQNADVLIDGKFLIKEKTLARPFVGSKNQRIINLNKTLETGNITIESSERWNPKKY